MDRRGWTLLITVVTVVALCIGGWSIGLPLLGNWLNPQHNSNARRYLNQTHAHHGFRRIAEGSEGTCNCNLSYYYIGPAGVDPAQVFTGPGLTLKPWPPESLGDTRPWDYLLEGTGNSKQTGYCNIVVNRYQHGLDPDGSYLGLSRSQRAEFRAGKLDILELYAGCAADGL